MNYKYNSFQIIMKMAFQCFFKQKTINYNVKFINYRNLLFEEKQTTIQNSYDNETTTVSSICVIIIQS